MLSALVSLYDYLVACFYVFTRYTEFGYKLQLTVSYSGGFLRCMPDWVL